TGWHTLGRVDTGLMAIATPNTSTTTSAPGTGQSYGAPLATVTTLFFMWGFLTCLNDILVPHLKSIFDLNYAQAMLIQFAFFGGLLILSATTKAIGDIRALAPDALQAYRLHEAATVKMPYVGLGVTLVVLAIAIGLFNLPKIEHAQHKVGEKVNDSIWNHPN